MLDIGNLNKPWQKLAAKGMEALVQYLRYDLISRRNDSAAAPVISQDLIEHSGSIKADVSVVLGPTVQSSRGALILYDGLHVYSIQGPKSSPQSEW